MGSEHDMDSPPGCVACEFEPFVKNNYFTGKMMGASDFIAETHFHQEKLRLHQARLHGWGVVCGLKVLQHPNADCRTRYVRVEPGSAVDCCGHDILVPEEEMLDLLSYKKVAVLGKENPTRIHSLSICVRFVECPTENVPVLYDDCGCDDNGCAPNRILESYAFDVLVDPPLAFLPRVVPSEISAVVFARSAQPPLAPNTPRFGMAPLVGSIIYALDAKQPQKLITYDLSTRHAATIDLGADAMAIAARGNFVFVATGPKGGTTEVVQVFEAAATTPIATIDLTATTSANTVAIVVSGDATRAAIAYIRETGALLAYAEDAANGLQAASASLGSVSTQLTSLVAKADGTAAYAIDEAGGKVKAITLAAASTETDVTALPSTARPSSLAYLEVGGKSLLAVGSRTDKKLYVIDAANIGAAAGLLATVALDHPPEFVAAGAQGVVYLLEEAGSNTFVQAVDLAPLTAGQPAPAIVSAPRMINATGLRLIGLLKDATAGIIASAEQIEIACAELVWNQNCEACDTPNCVTLASIERYQAGASVLDAGSETLADDLANKRARIDNRAGRKILASTQTLQAWLECLQTKGVQGPPGEKGEPGIPGTNGAPGKDGIGLYPDLPKILDIGWRFEERIKFFEFSENYFVPPNTTISLEELKKRVETGENVPPLTLYFNKKMEGITRHTLEVRIDAPFPIVEGPQSQPHVVSGGVYFPIDLKIYGDIIETGPVQTPHTNETAEYAVSFVPRRQFFMVLDGNNNPQMALPYWLLEAILVPLGEQAKLDPPRVVVSLKGNFAFAPDALGQYTELGVLDGDNIGGRVGDPPPATRLPPIQGGKNPSGNLTQGGLFESWFFLTGREAPAAQPDAIAPVPPLVRTFGFSLLGLERIPPAVNFSTAEEIVAAADVSDAVARRIVTAREERPYTGVDDLRNRARIPERDLAKLQVARRDGKILL